MKRIIILIAGVVLLNVLFCPVIPLAEEAFAEDSGSDSANLSALTDRFSADLSKDISGKKLYLDNRCVKEVTSGKLSNFSLYLQNELESSLSRNGFVMVYEPTEADYFIGATYQRMKDRVRVFFKYHKSDLSGKKGRAYEMPANKLPEDTFEESLQTKAYDLALSILEGQKPLKIFVKPLMEGHSRIATDFSISFTARIKCAMVKLGKNTEVIDRMPGIERTAAESVPRADAVLESVYYDRGSMISVCSNLRSPDGRLFSSCVLEIDKSLISSDTENKTARRLLGFLDPPQSRGDFHVKITTPKGKDYPIYSEGETIQFQVQVADLLYVYLYTVNSKGKISLLFPYRKNGPHRKMIPGRLYTIPDENSEFEISVAPPFGVEGVKVFASRTAIPLPELSESRPSIIYRNGWRLEGDEMQKARLTLSRMTSIHPRDLVAYFRGVAAKKRIPVFEDSLLLETRGH